MAVDPFRVVLDEPEVEGGEARDGAGDPDRRGDAELRKLRPHARCTGVEVVSEALGHPHAAEVEAEATLGEDQLGRAPADVDDHRPRRHLPPPPALRSSCARPHLPPRGHAT